MISNREILNRFDVLYNNIMSDSAPGLDAYEKSVFWNKATLEVLKNHLNPKGNKYGEGFDFSSKRQVEFSNLVVTETYHLFPQRGSAFNSNAWKLNHVVREGDEFVISPIQVPYSSMLAILNESLKVVDNEGDLYCSFANMFMIGNIIDFDYDKSGAIDISDATTMINEKNEGIIPDTEAIDLLIQYLIGNNKITEYVEEPKLSTEIISQYHFKNTDCVVVPISNVEYDTLMSRPYKYPPKSQVWRLFVNGESEFILGPTEAPAVYKIRYIRYPKDVNLADDTDIPEIPDVLYDEILQRAVELAKNSWEGNIETHKAFGERSE